MQAAWMCMARVPILQRIDEGFSHADARANVCCNAITLLFVAVEVDLNSGAAFAMT
jgi:hypothetical protein